MWTCAQVRMCPWTGGAANLPPSGHSDAAYPVPAPTPLPLRAPLPILGGGAYLGVMGRARRFGRPEVRIATRFRVDIRTGAYIQRYAAA